MPVSTTPAVTVPLWAWAAFTLFILSMLALDLGIFNRKSHTVSVKQALCWTAVWVSLAMIFFAGLLVFYNSGSNHGKPLEFLTGYIIEYALSVDNIFVFLLIFGYFKIAPEHQHKVLFWGILGALIMRALMITLGVTLISRFEWVLYLFGAFLVFTGIKMLTSGDGDDLDPGENPAIRLMRRFIPIAPHYDGGKFFTQWEGRRAATPLLIVLVVVETTDLVFAVDSIPAILGVVKSHDSFIVFTSNIFAILGLRSLYFALAGVMDLFHYLKYALSFILAFIGVKMLLTHTPFKIPTAAALGIVVGALALAVVASLLKPKPPTEREAKAEAEAKYVAEAATHKSDATDDRNDSTKIAG